MTQTPFSIDGAERGGAWVITCDHATNIVPNHVNGGTLGLPEAEMQRHIAIDIGALGVARALGEALNAPVVSANFSRLVIDPNRGADDPTLVPQLYDGTIIPGNRPLTGVERQRRIDTLYDPYHDAIARTSGTRDITFLAVHSFTPQLVGRPRRPWEIGVLSARDRRIADPLIASLSGALTSPVGDNAPYAGFFPGDAMSQHAHIPGRPNVILEIRQDLIAKAEDQRLWANLLAHHLEAAREQANL
ncbi:N-formylglutamate amidohydrolase [Tateyamaria sp. ANG-S1]|uniref:N-formylglutamate amidohydrolase n=1 Tax=Tateyamaria sp. ANG-S1 TaxID=1577905 RepID=UPI00057FAAEA|nr:N-formylglutamate amidohydrolase [Tateyamaria sp. ANG-S1]KIC52037.1 N-formylglutamate amidohydrolase [Tateyamaria sp. ANG-S1]